MPTLTGFWSYVHADDQAESGRISKLARDVADQFQMLTGESIELFLDKDAVEWGQNWKNKIDESLASIAFFMPVMTPRYFMSPECRRELQFFARRATDLGVKNLILPLFYVDVPGIEAETTDDLLSLVRTFQWEDWRELRFLETASERYRRGVARLASRLVDANRQAEQSVPAISVRQPKESLGGVEDDPPGLIDQIVLAEAALPKWSATIHDIGQEITTIGQYLNEATSEVHRGNTAGEGFAPRLAAARRLAGRLSEPVERIWILANESASQAHAVDEGFRALITQIALEVEKEPSSKGQACEFFKIICKLSDSMRTSLESVQQMINATGSIDKMSRDLRPVLRRLRQGLTILLEAREVSDEWVKLIKASGIVCKEEGLMS